MNLPQIEYTLLYNGKNITADISAQVLGIEYTDKVAGESDELQISLEDTDGRFQNSWYPTKGDKLQLIIRQNGRQLDCGVFEIDEPTLNVSIAGDIFSMKGLAAGISKKMRTKNSYAHENKTLREIANTVAGNLGLTLLGNVENIRINRAHQYRETDLGFLKRIGGEYGYIFSVRNNQLIFTHYSDVEKRSASITLTKQDLVGADMKDTTNSTYKNAKVKHHNPKSKAVVDYSIPETDPDLDSDSVDDLEIHTRVENKQQAESKAKYALYQANSAGVTGSITTPGNLLLVSGNNVNLYGLGAFSGTFAILEATHSISRDAAYTTSCNVKRVKKTDAVNHKTK